MKFKFKTENEELQFVSDQYRYLGVIFHEISERSVHRQIFCFNPEGKH